MDLSSSYELIGFTEVLVKLCFANEAFVSCE